MWGWSIEFRDDAGQKTRKTFTDQTNLHSYLLSFQEEELRSAKVYDPDERNMEAETYIKLYVKQNRN